MLLSPDKSLHASATAERYSWRCYGVPLIQKEPEVSASIGPLFVSCLILLLSLSYSLCNPLDPEMNQIRKRRKMKFIPLKNSFSLAKEFLVRVESLSKFLDCLRAVTKSGCRVIVKYWDRVLYTCCDVTQTWFKYLRGIRNGFTEFITNRVLHPPIILLQSTAYIYLTLGSWDVTLLHSVL